MAESNWAFIETLEALPRPFSDLLECYSGIPAASQVSHVLEARNRGYAHWPYPCLGRFRFVELDLSLHPLYKTYIVPALSSPGTNDRIYGPPKQPPIFLDLGTCLGQDIRKLAFDTNTPVPVENLYGADLRTEFIDLGYDLFCDELKLPRSQFLVPADVFDSSPTNTLSKLDGKVDILNITAVFHLFDLEPQYEIARRCLKLLNRRSLSMPQPEGARSSLRNRALIMGGQVGNITAGSYPRKNSDPKYRHNEQSWRELWQAVVAESEWKDNIRGIEVESRLLERNIGNLFGSSDGGEPSNNVQVKEDREKHIGNLEDGFRWTVWWVWVDFV